MNRLEDKLKSTYRVKNKRNEVVPFVPNRAQAFYLRNAKKKNIIIKARQKGLSQLLIAKAIDKCLLNKGNSALVSHEKLATQRLFQRATDTLESMIIPITLTKDSANSIKIGQAEYFIGTAGQKAFGRGDTLHYAHLSEASYYPDVDIILNGVEEAIGDNGEIDIETTPNGKDAIYLKYMEAKQGLNSYNPIFIPWYIDQEYSFEKMSADEIEQLSGVAKTQALLTEAEVVATLTEDEKQLIRKAKLEYNCEVTAGMIKWRRVKQADRGIYFAQEYPEDDRSCFITKEGAVFSSITVDPSIKVPLDNLENWKLGEYRDDYKRQELIKEIKYKRYYAGVDCAEGVPTGDNHCFSVYDPKAKGDKGGFIYEYTSNEPIDVFWGKIEKVIKALPNLELGIEKNGLGVAHTKEAQRRDITFYKWVTDGVNRPNIIVDLETAYRNGEILEGYTEAEAEALGMIYINDRADHPKGMHDDRVMSRGIALQIATKPQPRLTVG